jgi:hypothetical protein
MAKGRYVDANDPSKEIDKPFWDGWGGKAVIGGTSLAAGVAGTLVTRKLLSGAADQGMKAFRGKGFFKFGK